MQFLLLSSLAAAVSAQWLNSYPAAGQVAPMNSQWSTRFLQNVPSTATWGASLSTKTNCINTNYWGMTFSGGPNTGLTDSVVSQLSYSGVKATFFVTGSNVYNAPNSLRNAYNNGHEIGISGWSGQALTGLTNDQIVAEIMYTLQIVKELTGYTPAVFRPPSGQMDNRIQQIISNMGLTAVTWSYDSGDISGSTTVAQGMTNAGANKNGPISLQVDNSTVAVQQVTAAVQAIQVAGFQIQTMTNCLSVPGYNENIWSGLNQVTVNPSAGIVSAANPTKVLSYGTVALAVLFSAILVF